MEANEVMYKQAAAFIAADTGTGGLAEPGGVAVVRAVYRENSVEAEAVSNWPYIVIGTSSVDRSPPAAAASGTELFDGVLSFLVVGHRNQTPGYEAINRVEARLRARFNDARLPTLVDTDNGGKTWTSAPLGRVDPSAQPSTETELRLNTRYRCVLTKGATP